MQKFKDEEIDQQFELLSGLKKRYQPFELQLNENGGFQSPPELKLNNIFDKTKKVEQYNYGQFSEQLFIQNEKRRKDYYEQNNVQEELKISYDKQCEENKIKIMICITMYSESINELKKSLKGIGENLQYFLKDQQPLHQIAVFVIFDGIDKIRAKRDENGFFSEGDVVPYFKETYDIPYEIKGNDTLEKQYEIYNAFSKIKQNYSDEQINSYEEQGKIDKKIEQDREYLNKILKYQFDQLDQDNKKSYKQFLQDQLNQEDQATQNNGVTNQTAQIYDDQIKQQRDRYDKIDYLKRKYEEAKTYLQQKQNKAWVYQNTYKVKNSDKLQKDDQKHEMPIYFVFKYSNGTKLSSHLWFFKGFCHEFQPEYCVIMDCGAVPKGDSLFQLVQEMKTNNKIGGICGKMTIQLNREKEDEGEIEHMDPLSRFFNKYFCIERSQKFEYDLGNIYDKQLETTFNYVQVLPGAFSAYRYKAFEIQTQQVNGKNKSILDEYLRSMIQTKNQQLTLEEANMFLAEDRILCLLLFCNSYQLKYLRSACVEVDPCATLILLLFQRRRWINGTWFALNHVLKEFKTKLSSSTHSKENKIKFITCLVLASTSQVLQYFSISFQLIWLYMILHTLTLNLDPQLQFTLKSLGLFTYIFFVFCLIFLGISYNPSITNQIKDIKTREEWKGRINQAFYFKFYLISTILGLYSILTLIYTVFLFYREILMDLAFNELFEHPQVIKAYLYLFIILSIFFLAIPFLLQAILDFKTFCNLLRNSIHYVYFMNVYSHLFQIYAFCRIDDQSWGTKGLVADNLKVNNSYSLAKYKFVVKWIFLNSVFITIIFSMFFMKIDLLFQSLTLSFTTIISLISFLRCVFLIYYQIREIIKNCWIKKSQNQDHKHAQTELEFQKAIEAYQKIINEFYSKAQN